MGLASQAIFKLTENQVEVYLDLELLAIHLP
jgi:hypothetical protein